MRKETRCCHISYSFRLTARVLLYAPSHRQDSTYHGLCYTSRGALAGKRNSSMGSPHEGSIRRPIAPWANTLTTELHLARRSRICDLMPKHTVLNITGDFPAITSLWVVKGLFLLFIILFTFDFHNTIHSTYFLTLILVSNIPINQRTDFDVKLTQ